MAASMSFRKELDWRIFNTWHALMLCFSLLIAIRHSHGHGVNENLFFTILSPEDIAFVYRIRPARDFGASFVQHFQRIYLVPTDPEDACGSLNNRASLFGEIALVKRGSCSFVSKAITAERAGAVAVLIHDNNERNDESVIDMIDDNTDRTTSIPVAYLLGRDGYMIKNTLRQHGLHGALISIPVNITGVSLGRVKRSPWSLW